MANRRRTIKNIINKFNKKRFLACFVLIFVLLSLTFTTGYSKMKLTANFYYRSCYLDSITTLHIDFVDDYISIKGYI